jgi:hypothetical protein
MDAKRLYQSVINGIGMRADQGIGVPQHVKLAFEMMMQ